MLLRDGASRKNESMSDGIAVKNEEFVPPVRRRASHDHQGECRGAGRTRHDRFPSGRLPASNERLIEERDRGIGEWFDKIASALADPSAVLRIQQDYGLRHPRRDDRKPLLIRIKIILGCLVRTLKANEGLKLRDILLEKPLAIGRGGGASARR